MKKKHPYGSRFHKLFSGFNSLLLYKSGSLEYDGNEFKTQGGNESDMIGQNIRRLRTEKQMTQKALADKLFVTAQAVSRWENGEVEPSLSTVTEIARIFNVSADEILGIDTTPQAEKTESETTVHTEYVYKEPTPVLGVCEVCNKPIYNAGELIREDSPKQIICKSCRDKREQRKLDAMRESGIRHRMHSFVWGALAAVTMLVVGIVTASKTGNWGQIGSFVFSAVAIFTLVSCCILRNNFIGEMVSTIFSWGFVKFPGVIFELDLDGIIWLLTVKLLFWILGILLACATGLLAIALGGVMSLFVYPYAIRKNFAHPEQYED